MHIRVYNYNTMDKVKAFEAHTDYIRSIAVHPTQPYLLTCSDDMLIKLWDWDKVRQCHLPLGCNPIAILSLFSTEMQSSHLFLFEHIVYALCM